GVAGALDRGQNRLGPGLASEILDLADDLALGGLLPEEKRGEGDDEDQPRRQREDRVVRERRPQPRRAILVPLEERLTEQRPYDAGRETEWSAAGEMGVLS